VADFRCAPIRPTGVRAKNIPVPFLFETVYTSIRLVPTEGRIAIVTDAEWDAMDAAVSRVAMNPQGGPILDGAVSR
jgi:hypothetical protein